MGVMSRGERGAFGWHFPSGQVPEFWAWVGCFGGPSAEEENMGDKLGGDANPSGAESVSLGLQPCPRRHTKLSGDLTGIVSMHV